MKAEARALPPAVASSALTVVDWTVELYADERYRLTASSIPVITRHDPPHLAKLCSCNHVLIDYLW